MPPIPELMHRTFFRALSLLPPQAQGMVLGRFFDWRHRVPDPWKLSTDTYERQKYEATLEHVPRRPYRRIIEVGCAEGAFTRTLAGAYPEARIVGVDVSARALARARRRVPGNGRVRFVQADILTHVPEQRFDLVFCSETLYYLGRPDRLRQVSARLAELLVPRDGVLVAVHPWPEAGRLHRYLDADPALSRLAEEVYPAPPRPYAVTIYTTRAGPPPA
ncbi:methyltransferase domain-containing protein [Nonomuraea mesophila]|uniref:Methyltransferase domain-containing protein n=1 Tax=Nonomuraea mesophila TaxID=2530382 RepID=A0A4R5F3E1_9ACTN|nr:class I SAM-dependent methyltransferase [Nonomuraea mesophila]TDE41722.1 methyltransferase domain-containing protein [Nonomuraea mesophila]